MQYYPYPLRATPTTVKIVWKFTPVCCMQMCVCERIQHLFSSVCSLCKKTAYCTPVSIGFWIPGHAGFHTAIFLWAWMVGSIWKREKSQNELYDRWNETLLVFIFIFYISLNVQRVSCSIVKYLYIIYAYIFIFKLTLFGLPWFLPHVTYQFWRAERRHMTNLLLFPPFLFFYNV